MSSIIKVNEIQDGGGNTILSSDGSGNVTQTKTGILMADQWRLTADLGANTDPISANLEQVDGTGQGTLGSAMTVSSGRFTFPQTGIYLVRFFLNDIGGSSFLSTYSRLYVTTNNSSYTEVSRGVGTGGASDTQVIPCEAIIDVTDTSNVKVKFAYYHGDSGSTAKGDSDKNETYVTFLKLGAT